MKDGSGDLDFGESDGDDDQPPEETESEAPVDTSSEETQRDRDPQPAAVSSEPADSPFESQPSTQAATTTGTTQTDQNSQEYPYFVRRKNVLDERDARMEIHLRDEVSGRESDFRSDLADHLETNSVPKTDAREFALKFAFENPDAVAELMRKEGFNLLD